MATNVQEVYRNRVTKPELRETCGSQSSSCTDDVSDEYEFEFVAKVETKSSIKMTPNIQQSPPQKFKLPLSPLKRRESAKVHPIIPTSTITNDIENCREEMDWAKRVFYLSTERLFPGFRKSSETKRIDRNLYSTRIRSSLALAMLLLGSFYFNFVWALGWASLIERRLSTLKSVHGGVLFGCSVFSVGINHLRLRTGIKGNSDDDGRQLGIYWMMSAMIQLPLVTFFLLTDFFSPTFFPLSTILDTFFAILLASELVVGFGHLNSIIISELQVLRLAKETWKLTTRKVTFPDVRQSGLFYRNELIDSSDSESDNVCDSERPDQSDTYDYIETVKSEDLDVVKSRRHSSKRLRRVTLAANQVRDGFYETARIDTGSHQGKHSRKKKSKHSTMPLIEEEKSSVSRTQKSSSTSMFVNKKKSARCVQVSPVKPTSKKHRKSSPNSRQLSRLIESSPTKALLRRTSKSSEKIFGSSSIRKSMKRTESSGMLPLPLREPSTTKTASVSQRKSSHRVIEEKTAVNRKNRDQIESVTAIIPQLSDDIMSEAETPSSDSLPFSNLEEAEADYIYEMLSDNYSSTDDRERTRLSKPREYGKQY